MIQHIEEEVPERFLHLFKTIPVNVGGTAVRVGHSGVPATVGTEFVQQVDFFPDFRKTFKNGGAVRCCHGDDQVCFRYEPFGKNGCRMPGDVFPVFLHNENGVAGGGQSVTGAGPGGGATDRRCIRFPREFAEVALAHGTPAGIPGADKQDIHDWTALHIRLI